MSHDDLYLFYNCREGRAQITLSHEIDALLSLRPVVLGLCEGVGYRFSPRHGYDTIRDTSNGGRANIVAYVRKDQDLTKIRWTDLHETWGRTEHPGQHDARSILHFKINGRLVAIGHAPPKGTDNVVAAQAEFFDAMKHLLAPWTRPGWAAKAKVWRHLVRLVPRMVMMDGNARGSDPVGPQALATAIGGFVAGLDIDTCVSRRMTVRGVEYLTHVGRVILHSDHKHALSFRA